jgi:hypothetical protein
MALGGDQQPLYERAGQREYWNHHCSMDQPREPEPTAAEHRSRRLQLHTAVGQHQPNDQIWSLPNERLSMEAGHGMSDDDGRSHSAEQCFQRGHLGR